MEGGGKGARRTERHSTTAASDVNLCVMMLRICYANETKHPHYVYLNSSIMLFSGGRPTHALNTFSSIARCLASALTTGVPSGTRGALVR